MRESQMLRGRKRRALRLVVLGLALIAALALVGMAPPFQEACPADKGCVDITFPDETFRADFFVDGEQVASGGAQRLLVSPEENYRIEARNIRSNEEGYGDIFDYRDSYPSYVWLRGGQSRWVSITPQKNYLKGFLEVKCDVRAHAEGQDVRCRPNVAGQGKPDIAPGESASYPLLPGQQTVHIDLVGGNADLWAPASSDHTATVSAGRTGRVTATYQRKGLLTISFSPEGITGQLFVDDVQIAGNAATAEVYVDPSVSHTVEGRNIHDPEAGDVYFYQDVSTSAFVSANSTRAVTLRPRKEYLLGFLSGSCNLYGKADNEEAFCIVTVDDNRLGTVQSGESQTYNLTPGSHNVAITIGGARGRWWGAPAARTVNITGGRTSSFPVNLNRLPNPPIVAASNRMLAYVERVRTAQEQIANEVWRPLESGQPVSCAKGRVSVPADYSLTSTEKTQAPELIPQAERLNTAIEWTRHAVNHWRALCNTHPGGGDRTMTYEQFISGMSAVNDAGNGLNQVENRLNELINQALQ
jgi:hypothetical protein